MSKVVRIIECPSDKPLTREDHLTDDCVMEGAWIEHYGKFYHPAKPDKGYPEDRACVNWMVATNYYRMCDKEYPLRYHGNPPFNAVVHTTGNTFHPIEGFMHRCEDEWGGSWMGRWCYVELVYDDESNLDLWTVRASGNDDTSWSFDIIGEEDAVKYFEHMKKLPYNTITPDWCREEGWYFSN